MWASGGIRGADIAGAKRVGIPAILACSQKNRQAETLKSLIEQTTGETPMFTRVINAISIAFFLSVGVATAPAIGQETITLKLADQFPLAHIASRLYSQKFIKLVEERSKGRVKIRYFPAQQLATAGGMLDAVRSGITDIGFVGIVYSTQKMPLTSVIELPGLFSDVGKAIHAFELLNKQVLFKQEYQPLGLRPLWLMVSPPYQFVMKSAKPITDLSQIKGDKMRAAGGTGAMVLKAIGAVPVKVAPGDFYIALSRGTIQGAAYTPLGIPALKLYEVTKSVSKNASLGTVAFAGFINEKAWEKLPPDVQALLTEAGKDVTDGAAKVIVAASKKTYVKLAQVGMTVYDLPQNVLDQLNIDLKTVADNWLAQLSERGIDGRPVLEKFKADLAK